MSPKAFPKLGRVYKIVNGVNNKAYIGSTFDTIHKRFYKHKSNINTVGKRNCKLKTAMRECGTKYFSVCLVEELMCESHADVRKRENFWITKLETHLDGYNTKEAYSWKHSDHPKHVEKKEAHKKYCKEYMRKYVAENPEKLSKTKHRYYEEHKHQVKEYISDWKQKNSDYLKQKRREKITCECGVKVARYNIQRHRRTNKHKKYS